MVVNILSCVESDKSCPRTGVWSVVVADSNCIFVYYYIGDIYGYSVGAGSGAG